jgi:hypothetical protein
MRAASFGPGTVLLAAIALLGSSGCAKRLALEQKELERVQGTGEAGLDSLRVYTSERLVTTWVEGNVN